jgi:hypothetical protein
LAEQLFLFSRWGVSGTDFQAEKLWTGLNDVSQEGLFEWVSGEISSFSFFLQDEPNNSNGNEHYGIIWKFGDGLWNDVSNTSRQTFGIVEINVADATISAPQGTLFFTLLCSLLFLRNRYSSNR